MAAPGLLSLCSQMGALAYFAREHGPSAVLTFQTMLSMWAWTFVLAAGMDRAGRGFARTSEGLGAYAFRWRRRLVIGCVLGAAAGAGAGTQWIGGSLLWMVYGASLAACSMGYAGREWLLARGAALAVNKALSAAFVVGIAAMVLLGVLRAPFGWIAMLWFVPHAATWIAVCYRMGLFSVQNEPGSGLSYNSNWRDERPYGLQALGHVAATSIDLVIVQIFLTVPHEALRYIVYSRMVSVAFMVSVNFASVHVRGAVESRGSAWRGFFLKCAATHAGCALLAVCGLWVVGPVFMKLWLGVDGLVISGSECAGLACAAFARSACEAGMQTLSGTEHQGGALSAFGGYAAGLATLAVMMAFGLSPFLALAAAWGLPAIALLSWVAVRGGK